MKKYIFISIVCFSLVFCFNLYSKTNLLLGTDDWEPYEFKQNNIVTGFCTEILVEVFKKMNVKIKVLKIYPWKRGMVLLSKGDIDALYSGSRDVEREKTFFYPSEELFEARWVLFIRKENLGILKFDSLNDLKGKKVGVVIGYNYTPEFWDFLKKEKSYRAVPREEQNLRKLFSKRLHYMASEYGVGMSMIKNNGFSNNIIPLNKRPIKVNPMYIMFSKKTVSKDFVEKFSDKLRTFKTTTQYRSIWNKYFTLD